VKLFLLWLAVFIVSVGLMIWNAVNLEEHGTNEKGGTPVTEYPRQQTQLQSARRSGDHVFSLAAFSFCVAR
jgi:hypothetical protein